MKQRAQILSAPLLFYRPGLSAASRAQDVAAGSGRSQSFVLGMNSMSAMMRVASSREGSSNSRIADIGGHERPGFVHEEPDPPVRRLFLCRRRYSPAWLSPCPPRSSTFTASRGKGMSRSSSVSSSIHAGGIRGRCFYLVPLDERELHHARPAVFFQQYKSHFLPFVPSIRKKKVYPAFVCYFFTHGSDCIGRAMGSQMSFTNREKRTVYMYSNCFSLSKISSGCSFRRVPVRRA